MRLTAKKGVNLYRDYYLKTEMETLPLPAQLKVPIAGGGDFVIWQKTIGDTLQKYEVIARLDKDIPVYSPCNGILREIVTGPALGKNNGTQYAVIEVDPTDVPSFPLWNTEQRETKDGLLKILRLAAILEENTKKYLCEHIKKEKSYNKLLIDCVDDQPFDLSRTVLLSQRQDEIIGGAKLLMHALKISSCAILLRKNFCTDKFFSRGALPFSVVEVAGKYPASPAIERFVQKQQALCIGPDCCRAVYRAAVFGEPQLTHLVTVWGEGVNRPANLDVPRGVPVSDLLSACEATGILERVIGGGVMRGYSASLAWPLFPWDGALTIMPLKRHHKTVQCINCGRCALVCPQNLAPYYINRTARKIGERRARELTAEFCIGCGACSYICPARIALKDLIEQYKVLGEKRGEQ